MTIVHYTNSLSAHQLPLDYELVKIVGAENFRYIYTNEYLQGGAQEVNVSESWIVRAEANSKVEVGEWLENCDLLIVGGIRPIDLMERRLAAGKAVFYMSERWFKPFLINLPNPFFAFTSRLHLKKLPFYNYELQLPGWLRLLHPRYFRMARRFAQLFRSPHYRYLPIGPWSACDMALLMRVMGFSRVEVERCRERFVKWGDFVEPSEKKLGQESRSTAEGSNLPSHAGEARERGSDFQVASEQDQSSIVQLHLSPSPSHQPNNLTTHQPNTSPVPLFSTPIFSPPAPQSNNPTIQQSNNPTIKQFPCTPIFYPYYLTSPIRGIILNNE